ncbi:MAG: GreA/GreB family elongation factor [Waddliaceae bacterium]
MSYLDEFRNQINNLNFQKFFQLWEEYCTNDRVDVEEFEQLLILIKESEFAPLFGQLVETALPLWQCIENEEDAYRILQLLIDLQQTNTPLLAETAYSALEKKYGLDPHFKEKIRQVGLLTRDGFQGAISHFELLSRMKKGKFVFHSSGWGTGEVIDVSPLREQVAVEFEMVAGVKHLTFDNAFKTLIPLDDDHFLSCRFGDPDLFEEKARKNPVEIIKILLRDLGPKTAGEVKEELCVLVIPEEDWSKWWQTTRAKLKKDPMIDSPASIQGRFALRASEISQKERFCRAIENQTTLDGIIHTSYSFVRDFPHLLQKEETKKSIKERLIGLFSHGEITRVQEFQIFIFLESLFDDEPEGRSIKTFIENLDDIETIVNAMDIIAFKKRALLLIRKYREDWADIFFALLFLIEQNPLREYVFKELLQDDKAKNILISRLNQLVEHPETNPGVFIWYFQKIMKGESKHFPFSDKEGQCRLLEALLILFQKFEADLELRGTTKKVYTILTAKQFAIIRRIIKETGIEFLEEFLLLVSKCHTFSPHEQKIIRSLARVVQPSLAPEKKQADASASTQVLWTTEEGYLKTQDRIKHIATVEMVENAREVEAARAHGDLRENAEYKFAVEKRARLQGELKFLSKQFSMARIITEEDISPDKIDIGSKVDLEDSQGRKISYAILGPWEADPEKQIISYESQFAKAMVGHRIGDTFIFRDEKYRVLHLEGFF